MKLRDRIKIGRYLRRIIALITISILFVVAVFSTVIYLNVDKAVMENEDKVNRRVLLQVKTSIDQTQDTIVALCLSVYLNADAISTMYDTHPDYVDTSMKINRLRSLYLGVNPYVDSIIIYNGTAKTYFTSNNGLFYNDRKLTEFIQSKSGNLVKMRPQLRAVDETPPGYTESFPRNVFTYFMYDSMGSGNMPDGAVIVNVKSEWLLDSIQAMNSLDNKTDDRLFLIDSDSQFIGVGQSDPALQAAIKDEYGKHVAGSSSDAVNSFRTVLNGKDYLISYVVSQKTGWVILKSQPINEVYEYINNLKTSILLITGVFLLLTVVVSFTVSRGIYSPIRDLVDEISHNPASKPGPAVVDEIAYIHSVLNQSAQQLSEYQATNTTNQSIMKSYFLRRLLLESDSIDGEAFARAREEYSLGIGPDRRVAVVVLRSEFSRISRQSNPIDAGQIKLFVTNAFVEALSALSPEAVDPKEDHIVLLVNVPEAGWHDVAARLRDCQKALLDNAGVSVSVSVGEPADVPGDLSKQYNIALSNSMYAYVYGDLAFIDPALVAANNACRFRSFSTTLERKLSEEIKGGNLDSVEDTLKKILAEIQGLNYKNMMLSVMHLVNVISDTVEDINRTRIGPVFTDYNAFQSILDACSIEALHDECMAIFRQIMVKPPDMEKQKHAILIDTVKEIILTNYQKTDLCLAQISDILKMSSGYVGKIFKNSTDLSVAEYINEVRLDKAAELLRDSSDSIGDIVGHVGMENESYFYKLFKKKFGATPKEYVLKWGMSQK